MARGVLVALGWKHLGEVGDCWVWVVVWGCWLGLVPQDSS